MLRDPKDPIDSMSGQIVGVRLLSTEILELQKQFWMLNTVLAVTFTLSSVPGVAIYSTNFSGKRRIARLLSDLGAMNHFCEIPRI